MLSGPILRGRRFIAALATVAVVGGGLVACGLGSLRSKWSSDQVSFSRDIRPILNQNCVACHGGVRQKNGVSFIFREEALGVREIRTADHRSGQSRCLGTDGAGDLDGS